MPTLPQWRRRRRRGAEKENIQKMFIFKAASQQSHATESENWCCLLVFLYYCWRPPPCCSFPQPILMVAAVDEGASERKAQRFTTYNQHISPLPISSQWETSTGKVERNPQRKVSCLARCEASQKIRRPPTWHVDRKLSLSGWGLTFFLALKTNGRFYLNQYKCLIGISFFWSQNSVAQLNCDIVLYFHLFRKPSNFKLSD